jgi:Iap family predicted aminopeptidase
MGPVNPAAFSKKTIMGRDVTLYTTPYIQALSTGWAGCYWLLRFHFCLGPKKYSKLRKKVFAWYKYNGGLFKKKVEIRCRIENHF